MNKFLIISSEFPPLSGGIGNHAMCLAKTIMRVHSVYHNNEILFEKYKDLTGGLNKMTIKKAIKIINSFRNIDIEEKKVNFLWKGKIFKNIPVLKELFSSSLYVKLKKR